MPNLMLDNVYRGLDGLPPRTLVDLGYVKDKDARDRGDKLIAAGIARRNFSIEGFGRLLVTLPPKKADAILKQFPNIVLGTTYFQTTHHWRGLANSEKRARAALASVMTSPVKAAP